MANAAAPKLGCLIMAAGNASRFGAVGCVDGMAFISENVREHFSDTKFVIDDKDF